MYRINNFTNNDDVKILESKGAFSVIEYQRDLSVTPGTARLAYYSNKMNVKKRQVVCYVSKSPLPVSQVLCSGLWVMLMQQRE